MNVLILSDAHLQQLNELLQKSLEEASNFDHSESDSIDQLMVALRAEPSCEVLMEAAVSAGAKMGHFMNLAGIANSEDDYSLAANRIYREHHGDDFELDDKVMVERSVDGAFVSSWVWVASASAGIPEFEDLATSIVKHIHGARPGLAVESPVVSAKVDLINTIFAESEENDHRFTVQELVNIDGESPAASLVLAGEAVTIKMSDLLREVSLLAAELEFDPFLIKQVDLWLEEYGVAFDQAFHTIQQA
jgi:hypothetical protein